MNKIISCVLFTSMFMIGTLKVCTAQSKKSKEVILTKTAIGTIPGKMIEFMKMLNGEEGCTKKAAETYFSTSLLQTLEASNSLSFNDYLLRDSEIVSIDYKCCVMEAKAGVVVRKFDLCWEDDKIVSIKDLGIK